MGKLPPQKEPAGTESDDTATRNVAVTAEDLQAEAPIDWQEALRPRGRETRLGQALRQVINEHRTEPISGIVVVTDGRQNAGIDPTSAARLAVEAKIPVHTIGIGSDKKEPASSSKTSWRRPELIPATALP